MKRLLKFFLSCFVIVGLMNISLEATDQKMINVDDLPTLRTQQYSKNTYDRIIINSASRTGSSLIYNVFRFLFEDESRFYDFHFDFDLNRSVLKTHRHPYRQSLTAGNNIYIFTVRNPIEAVISLARLGLCKQEEEFAEKEALRCIKQHVLFLSSFERIQRQQIPVMLLKYEDFVNDFDYLFDSIEKKFNISIALKDKELMKKGLSKKNVAQSVEHISIFSEMLPSSGFHGQHIASEEYTPNSDFIYWLHEHFKKYSRLFNRYGYFLEK